MCLAIPARILTIDGVTATCDLQGNTTTADISLVPESEIGDYIIIHAGLAIQRYDEVEARKTLGQILLGEGRGEEALDSYRALLDHLALPEKNYQCARCGFESSDVLWKCPQCLSWDTLRAVAAPDPSTVKPSEADEAQG